MYGSLRLPASSSRCGCPANIQSIKRWDLAAATSEGSSKEFTRCLYALSDGFSDSSLVSET